MLYYYYFMFVSLKIIEIEKDQYTMGTDGAVCEQNFEMQTNVCGCAVILRNVHGYNVITCWIFELMK